MLPDIGHFMIVLLLAGALLRVAEYLLAANFPDNPLYKFLVFAY